MAARQTAPPQSPHDSQGTGGSAGDPSSRTLCHSAGRSWVLRMDCVSGVFHIDGVDADS
jgi:hypothetical protein